MRYGMPGAWPVVLTIRGKRLLGAVPVGNEMGKAVGQGKKGGRLSTAARAAQNPDFRHGGALRIRAHVAEWMLIRERLAGEPGEQIPDLGWEAVRRRVRIGVQRVRGPHVR